MHIQLMKIRKARGWKNRDDFADHIGVNRYTYRSWENGSVTPNAEQVCLCATALKCTPNDIVGWYLDHPEDQVNQYADPRQEKLNGCYESLNDESKSAIVDVVASYANDARRRVEKNDGEGSHDPLALGNVS